MSISSEKYYLWSPEHLCGGCQWSSAYGERSLGEARQGKGLFSALLKNGLDCSVPAWSSLSPDKKDRAERNSLAGWFLGIIWVGQAEESVLGHRVCTPHRWCFETVSASFLPPQLCVGIASCLKNVFPFRMCLIVSSLLIDVQKGCFCDRIYFFFSSVD